MPDAARYASLLANGKVVNHYQPIVGLQSGKVLGVEVLARLDDNRTLIPPGIFLPTLGTEALEDLLFTSLPRGLAALAACRATHPTLFMSFNVSPSVMLRPGFVDTLLSVLAMEAIDPTRITLEILEDDEFLSLHAARRRIEELHAAGISIALDDVGTGYSSLNRLRELPVQKIKLDQAFVRELHRQPESLHFVSAMLSLARGLHTLLIVEGVETPRIMEALSVLGVDGAQGYAIARPMPEPALATWLATWEPMPVGRQPESLLGAYAAHLGIVEACRALINQPLKFAWSDDVRDPHACAIGRFFDENGLHDTECGHAHKRFHRVIDKYSDDPVAWEEAASDLWRGLQKAIMAETRAQRLATRASPDEPIGDVAVGAAQTSVRVDDSTGFRASARSRAGAGRGARVRAAALADRP